MLRSDRNLVEKYFSQGLIKLLICTATLAWGVNLPAHAIIYDAKHGSFVNIGILDVLQIFGRADPWVRYGSLGYVWIPGSGTDPWVIYGSMGSSTYSQIPGLCTDSCAMYRSRNAEPSHFHGSTAPEPSKIFVALAPT